MLWMLKHQFAYRVVLGASVPDGGGDESTSRGEVLPVRVQAEQAQHHFVADRCAWGRSLPHLPDVGLDVRLGAKALPT